MESLDQEYAGFWIRVGASIIDTIIIMIIILPILRVVYGEAYWFDTAFVKGFWDLVFSYILPAVGVVIFWVYKSATPGKITLRLTIIDAKTGNKPTTGQFVIRYLGYYVSMLPLFLGFIWVGIDPRKQGWHDKLAGTVVLRNARIEPVKFEG